MISGLFANEIWGAYIQEGLFSGGGALLSEFYGILLYFPCRPTLLIYNS